MSNPADSRNPYSQATQQGAPNGYPQQQQRPAVDRGVLRQVLFGGAVVMGIAIVSNVTSFIGISTYAFQGELLLSMVWRLFLAVIFTTGAGLSALYFAPLATVTSTVHLLKRLAIAAAIGAAALFVLNFVWSVVNGGQYLVQMIIDAGVLGSLSTALQYSAYFALGVFVARALPPTFAWPGAPQAQAGQQAPGVPQWYVQPQGPGAPLGYHPHGPAVPQAPAAPVGSAPQGYVQGPGVPLGPVPLATASGQPPVQQQPPHAPPA